MNINLFLVCFKIFIATTFCSQEIGFNKQLILTYLSKLKDDKISLNHFMDEYHSAAGSDEKADAVFTNVLEQRRKGLQEIDLDQIIIKEFKKGDNLEDLTGLDWQKGIYAVYYNNEFLMPVLIGNGKIVSTIVMSKGERKFFLLI